MWRKVCLITGVLTGHLALLGWLQLGSEGVVAVAPTLRFQLGPTVPPTRPTAPALTPESLASLSRPIASKVKKPSPVTAQTPTVAARPTAIDPAVSTPAASLGTDPGVIEQTGEAGVAPGPHTGVTTLVSTATATAAAGKTTVLPSSNADYLNNPAPAYPALSRRLGEQGRVVIRVLIDKDGKPQQGDIGQSSGYARLDQAALRAAMDWRYVPGRRDGKAQDMWFNVPIQFALE